MDAETNVSPLMAVSTTPVVVSGVALLPVMNCCVCRIMNVNLNVSSSSLLSLIIKFGKGPAGSGSWNS